MFFRYYSFAIVRRILRQLPKTIYYHTKYGLKFIQRKEKSEYKERNLYQIVTLDPKELCLGIDGLYDDYTLIGVNITDSPHYELISILPYGDIANCDYIRREENGSLDSRDFKYIPLKKHKKIYKKTIDEMQLGLTKPILFYTIEGKKYIRDGKHRAALYAYYNRSIQGIEISKNEIMSEYSKKLYAEIDRHHFAKHREVLSYLYRGNKL